MSTAAVIIAVAGVLIGFAMQPLYELLQKYVITPLDNLNPAIKPLVGAVVSAGLTWVTQFVPNLPTDLHSWSAATVQTLLTWGVGTIVNYFVKKSQAKTTTAAVAAAVTKMNMASAAQASAAPAPQPSPK